MYAFWHQAFKSKKKNRWLVQASIYELHSCQARVSQPRAINTGRSRFVMKAGAEVFRGTSVHASGMRADLRVALPRSKLRLPLLLLQSVSHTPEATEHPRSLPYNTALHSSPACKCACIAHICLLRVAGWRNAQALSRHHAARSRLTEVWYTTNTKK